MRSVSQARILLPTPENFALAAEALQRGEVVGMPTETVYGLAGDAFNPLALARIFETKERPTFDPLIIHVGHVGPFAARVEDLARIGLVDDKKLSPAARDRANALIKSFWPGPLTLVLPKSEKVPDLATSGLPTVALRMPKHPAAQALIAASRTPLAAPSANRFGRISPTSAQDVFDELGDRIDFILDGGPCEIGVESTIVAISESGELTLLRPGGLAPELIEKVAGAKLQTPNRGPSGDATRAGAALKSGVATQSDRNAGSHEPKAMPAPGMLESHYAPAKKLKLLSDSLDRLQSLEKGDLFGKDGAGPKKIALLVLFGSENDARERFQKLTSINPTVYVLSPSSNIEEAAKNLFRTLREMDRSDADLLFSEPCRVEFGLGFAIGDRLRRASAEK
jgi:L-threonylcarbamoyladenylate synthase